MWKKNLIIIVFLMFVYNFELCAQFSKTDEMKIHPSFATVFENALRKQNSFVVYSIFRDYYKKNNIYFAGEKKNIEKLFFKPFGKNIKYVNVEVLEKEDNQVEIRFRFLHNGALDQKKVLNLNNKKGEFSTQLYTTVIDLIAKIGEEEK